MKYAVLAGDREFKIQTGQLPIIKRNPLIKVSYAGICGTDISYWRHGSQYEKLIIGHEYSGIIEDPGTSGLFKKGDHIIGYTQNVKQEACGHCENCLKEDFLHCDNRKVLTWKGGEYNHPGAYSEYTTWFPSSIYKIPEYVDLAEASLIEPFTVGLHAVNISEIQEKDKVLILGGGIIGLAVAEWVRLRGVSEITITEMSKEKIYQLNQMHLVTHVMEADEKYLLEHLLEISKGGYDVVFDCVGFSSAINVGIAALKKEFFKKFIAIALPYEPILIDYSRIVLRQVLLKGSKGHQYNEFITVAKALCERKLELKKYITRIIDFVNIQEGFQSLENSKDINFKTVIRI